MWFAWSVDWWFSLHIQSIRQLLYYHYYHWHLHVVVSAWVQVVVIWFGVFCSSCHQVCAAIGIELTCIVQTSSVNFHFTIKRITVRYSGTHQSELHA